MSAHLCLRGIAIVLFATAPALAAGSTIHVDDDAPPGGDGVSWATAYRHLSDALATAPGAAEIRVAQGLYVPDRSDAHPGGTGDRAAAFALRHGVPVIGGYAGRGAADPDAHDPEVYVTILSGDLLGDDGPDFAHRADNAYSVVEVSDGPATLFVHSSIATVTATASAAGSISSYIRRNRVISAARTWRIGSTHVGGTDW